MSHVQNEHSCFLVFPSFYTDADFLNWIRALRVAYVIKFTRERYTRISCHRKLVQILIQSIVLTAKFESIISIEAIFV